MFNSSSNLEERKKSKRKGKIWQLFRATDFQSLMYPCFVISRILGIFPYKISASNVEICPSCYMLSTAVVCVYGTLQLVILYDMNVAKNILFQTVTRRLERNSFYIFGAFITVTTFILNKPRMRFLRSILKHSLKLSPVSYQHMSKLIHLKDICGFFFVLISLVYSLMEMHFSLLRKWAIVYLNLVMYQMDMLYMNCVCVLKACFKQINDSLTHIREVAMNGEPYILNDTGYKQRNQFLLIEIEAVKKQHQAVSEAVHTLETIFSLQLITMAVMTFTQITFNLYFIITQMKSSISISDYEKSIYYSYSILITAYHLIKIMLIVWACETGKRQAMEIAITVHEIFNSTSNEQIKYELRLFSLQLMHHKNTFSIKGLNMDASLLTSVRN
ncbi:hypothetical protein PUN28_000206 [Cardiocondyla obscurior]|uniref:Gustatory receptor n=1 Tax=Cardiocondyla obscurior TaxID=286306 RepID=A0AAW2GYP5_9HYME